MLTSATLRSLKYTLLVFMTFFTVIISAQAGERDGRASRQHILALKGGVVLVRLHNYKQRIALLKENGHSKEASILQKQSEERNRSIILAFRENFKFARIYFFYADESALIQNKQFSEVHWIGESPEITADSTYFIAEINMLDKTNQSGGELTFEALILRDGDFKQLRRPFPYYSRTYGSLPGLRDMPSVISKMNTKLVKYHQQTIIYLQEERKHEERIQRMRQERERRELQRKQEREHQKADKEQRKKVKEEKKNNSSDQKKSKTKEESQ